MKIIEKTKSGLIKGHFLNTYLFEDDTLVFYTEDGFEVENVNNIKTNQYYINIVKINL